MSKQWLKTDDKLLNLEKIDVIEIITKPVITNGVVSGFMYYLYADNHCLKNSAVKERLLEIFYDIRKFIINEHQHIFDLTRY